ncbi:hypothetical protein BDZ90DRAFT_232721 [Jaminaea rosea]|uniref:Exocyst complex component Sec3 PIP2-binding N-terminal domain-containing protein n=1 Tax=Jaminaea rosea TaxID=1569628 RepID=A0A316UPD9_9BASI|nr:hypothetical protein BDZ90DRAFT_232721 [Jaminaea rosea]PWN27166.1 hypothetical protein BDZ90DRAFT_232721 [Jaminaea rosea]
MASMPPPATSSASSAAGSSAKGSSAAATGASSSSSSGQSTKDAFNAALRSRNPQNNYIAHLKIWESVDDAEGAKPSNSLAPTAATAPTRKARYLILAVQRDTGKVTINKAKRNANGSFSIGKDWDLNTLRVVEVTEPTQFTLTLSRSYSWTTDRAREQSLFLTSLINVYRKYTRDAEGPRCIGIDAGGSGTASSQAATGRAQSPTTAMPVGPAISPPKQQQPHLSASSPPRQRDREELPSRSVMQAQVPDPIQRSASADPYADRSPQRGAVPLPSSTDGFYDANSNQQRGSEAAPKPPSAPLLSPITRRPSLMRNDSAMPRLETSVEDMPTPRGFSPAAPNATLPTSASSGQMPAAGSGKNKLSERLARVAAGANNGRSSPTGSSRGPSPLPPATASSSNDTTSTASSATRRAPSRQDSNGSSSSSTMLSTPQTNARARLSSLEPVGNRGGKAYERMLLAGTGLKSIGDEDEEEEEEDGQERMETMAPDDEDIYGGAVVGEESDHPSKRNKAVARSGSLSRKRSARRKQTGSIVNGGNTANGIEADELDDELDATLLNVEEMLEGIDFRTAHKNPGLLGLGALGLSGSGGGGGAYSAASNPLIARAKGQGTADLIEASLLSELQALDSANIHSILNGDDRLTSVLNHVDSALAQLDSIDSLVASYKLSLNSRAEDIGFIESQNRGLQVMNANWRALQREIEQLSSTINVPTHEVELLLARDYEVEGAIEAKESAAASLYRAILQARTSQMEEHNATSVQGGMAASTERLEEYSNISATFGSRLLQHLSSLFAQLASAIVSDPMRKGALQPPKPTLTTHDVVETTLGSYCGLMLYAKEVEPKTFERISAAYLTSAAERYKEEVTRLVGVWKMLVRSTGEDEEVLSSFAPDPAAGSSGGGGGLGGSSALSRSTTVRRLAGGGSSSAANKKAKSSTGEVSGSEAFHHILLSLSPLLIQESLFLSDFLHLNSNGLTFADYMDFEVYFRRRAAAIFAEAGGDERKGGLRDMRGALELVFGFLTGQVDGFFDEVGKRDRFQVVGVLAALDNALLDAEDASNDFLMRTLNKWHVKANASLDRFFAEQIKAITASAGRSGPGSSSYAPSFRGRKGGRGGLIQPVRVLPHFVERLEAQLVGAENLGIRSVVDSYYAKMETTLIDALVALKVDASTGYGGGVAGAQDEDKGIMNHQVLLIENMHHVVQETSKLTHKAPALSALVSRADKMYEDSLSNYVHFVLRRPLGKLRDFADGIDSLLKGGAGTPASEVSLHSAYSKASFKRLVKEYTTKDVRKQVDALWKRVLKHFDEDDDEGFTLAGGSSKTGGVSANAAAAMLDSDELASGAAAEEEERRRVVGKVWRRCEQDFFRDVERLLRIQAECYKGSGVSIELQTGDVVRFFQR